MKNLKYTEKRDWIFLFIGIAITALFLIFSTQIYELLYYNSEFSNEMYNENMYFVLASATALVCWFIAVMYYLIIDRFDRWYHWLIALALTLVCTPIISYSYPDSIFSEMNFDFSVQLINFAIVNIIVALVLFLIVSFSVKSLRTIVSGT